MLSNDSPSRDGWSSSLSGAFVCRLDLFDTALYIIGSDHAALNKR